MIDTAPRTSFEADKAAPFENTKPQRHHVSATETATTRASTAGAKEMLGVGGNGPYPVALDEDYTVPVHADACDAPPATRSTEHEQK